MGLRRKKMKRQHEKPLTKLFSLSTNRARSTRLPVGSASRRRQLPCHKGQWQLPGNHCCTKACESHVALLWRHPRNSQGGGGGLRWCWGWLPHHLQPLTLIGSELWALRCFCLPLSCRHFLGCAGRRYVLNLRRLLRFHRLRVGRHTFCLLLFVARSRITVWAHCESVCAFAADLPFKVQSRMLVMDNLVYWDYRDHWGFTMQDHEANLRGIESPWRGLFGSLNIIMLIIQLLIKYI